MKDYLNYLWNNKGRLLFLIGSVVFYFFVVNEINKLAKENINSSYSQSQWLIVCLYNFLYSIVLICFLQVYREYKKI